MMKWNSEYYFDENGVMQKGFVLIDNKTYCFGNDGRLYRSTWITVGEDKYYAKSDGTMAKDETITKWFKDYTFDGEGKLIK